MPKMEYAVKNQNNLIMLKKQKNVHKNTPHYVEIITIQLWKLEQYLIVN